MNYLLLFLYIYQSSMLSIFTQIMPILLAEHGFNYEQQGLFSLVAYPFFFKIIFAPIIDLFHFKSLGRRRSYILPCTILMSFNLFWQSSLDIQQNYVLFCLIGLFNATFLGMQDIAIDGFAADLCKKTNESSAHILNVGYTIGSSFLANFLFHSLNKYQLCSLSTYLKMISVFGLSMAAYLLFHVKEEPNSEQIKKLTGFKQVIRGIFGNENLITLSLLLFFDRYGVAPIESTFRIKLTELKFNKAYVSFMDTAILPLKIAVGFVYHKYFSKYNFEYYGYVQGFRLISCIFATLTIFLVDVVKVNDTISYIALFIASTTWWIVFNLTFIVRGNFQMRITTQGYEATTLALMNSLGSLGGKTGFSLCMFLTEYVNYYCFACFALVAQLLFTLKSIKWYKRLYNVPKEKYSIIKQNLKSE
ncbi:unnamed protein product [Paramecium octaurelia]|uniref:Acetyl-CoA transporter n=1 Tax=Paramecium octaurelia TaxID=43137 RepID=A0A8S1Y7I3_PAROT|nr:unnamed protein product [Paramecium octaurelia]